MKFRVRNPDIAGSRAAPHHAGAGLLKYVTAIVILCGLVSMLLGYPSCSSAAEEYTFGVVPQYGQRQLFAIWKPILDELQLRTGLRFKLVTAPKIPVFEKAFLDGSYDFVYLNPYHLLRANKAQGYVPIVRDRINLHGILVIRKDSPVRSVSDLNEKVVAFPSPNALGASLLMRADLVKIHHVVISPLYVTSHSFCVPSRSQGSCRRGRRCGKDAGRGGRICSGRPEGLIYHTRLSVPSRRRTAKNSQHGR